MLAIDQGTSSTKALVVSEDGEVLGEAQVGVHPKPVGDGGVEQDPRELLHSIVDAGREALASASVVVGAVGVANQGETVVAWDPITGDAVSSAITWQDRRSSVITDGMLESADRLRELTGLPLDPYFTAPKLRWLTDRVPPSSRVTGIDAWLNYQLTGRVMTDASTASRSLLLDLDSRTWSAEAGTLFGIDVDSLPEVVDCAGDFGETTLFGPALAVTGLAVDQQAALVGENCLEAGEGKCTYGTGAFLLVTTGAEPRRSRNGLSASVAWQFKEEHGYCLDGQIYTAGSAVDWLRKLKLIRDASHLDELARNAAADSSVLCVPSLAGLGAPYWQPHAKAHLEGMTLDTGPSELVYAVLEGLACQVATLVRAAEADLGQDLSVLRVDGGLTRSEVLMQLQADLLQVPVDLFPSPHATALGIASLARAGAIDGPIGDRVVHPKGRRFEPSISSNEASDRLEAWKAAVRRVMEAAGAGFKNG
ncbi:MAG: FGGY family carbohydrate kinase [Acidimicrobiales bacterium]